MKGYAKWITGAIVALALGSAAAACTNKAERAAKSQASDSLKASASVRDLMKQRGLVEADVEAALRTTYRPASRTST
jgi:hypothetical protein